jgi:hypothetical protein
VSRAVGGRRAGLVLAAALAACATPRPAPEAAPAGATEVRFGAGEVVEVTPLDRELAGKNDAELLAVGRAAAAAGDDRRAAAAYGRLADLWPTSSLAPEARREAARAEARRGDWRASLARARSAQRDPGGEVAATFLVASAQWHLGENAAARDALGALLARPDLPRPDRVRALVERGVVEIDLGEEAAAERDLREAVALWTEGAVAERLDRRLVAQAHYHLGELDRRRCAAVALDPAGSTPEELEASLERASSLLLSAQGHYLDSIRAGDPEWGVASGRRVGEMYADLRGRLLAAPPPPGLSEAEQKAYRSELRRQTRVLLEKAVSAYDQTLAAARLGGVDGPLLDELAASLERARAELLADDAR